MLLDELRQLEMMFDFDYSDLNTKNYTHSSSDKEIVFEMAVPGVSKEDLKIEVVEDTLIVETKTKSKSRLVKDIHRKWHLGNDIDVNNISASLNNGLLTLTLPKVKPAKKTIAIAVS